MCPKKRKLLCLFVLFCLIYLTAAEDEVESISTDPPEETVSTNDPNSTAASDANQPEQTVPTAATIDPNSLDALDEEKCSKRRKGCCDEMHLGDEDVVTRCFTIHQGKLPAEGETNPAKLFKFMSCFVECIYKQKKYIGKGDTINMKMVRKDAEKMFADRPKERDYHIEMFEFCRKDGAKTYNLIKNNPAAKILLMDACRPFFMFVFFCQTDYHKKKNCPYFRWEGKAKSGLEDCQLAKEKCYEIDGIIPP